MSRRNFILLIIVLLTITFGVLYYFYASVRPGSPTDGEGGTNFFSEFNPFNTSPRTPQNQPPAAEPDPETPAEIGALFRRVSSMPIAGYGLIKKERLKEIQTPAPIGSATPTPPQTELVSAARYVSRANGNIYQAFVDNLDERKFSDTIIPKVYEAHFGNNGLSVVMRYLKADEITIETFIGTLPKEVLGADTGNIEVKGTFLPENVTEVVLSSDKLRLLYLAPSSQGISLFTFSFTDGKRTPLFNSDFTEWQALWPNSRMVALTTRPSALAPGYMYTVDPAVKKFVRVLGDINGLTTLASPDGKLVLYSGSDLSLGFYDIGTKTTQPVGLRTMPEKCVWAKNNFIYCAVPTSLESVLYPDAWYKGGVSFSDQIWKIDALGGTTEMIFDPGIATVELDGIKLGLDADEKYLFMVNKKDSYLWELELD